MAIDIAAVATGLLTSALFALFAKLGSAISEDLRNDPATKDLRSLLQKATDDVAEEFTWYGPGRLEEVCLFLASPDAESIVRQVYATRLTPDDQDTNLNLIRSEFVKSLALYVELTEEEVSESAGQLFETVCRGCQTLLCISIDKGILSAHETQSAYRHRLLVDEIAGVQKRLDLFARGRRVTIEEIDKFEESYRKQIAIRHGYIVPPHFDAVKKLPISGLSAC